MTVGKLEHPLRTHLLSFNVLKHLLKAVYRKTVLDGDHSNACCRDGVQMEPQREPQRSSKRPQNSSLRRLASEKPSPLSEISNYQDNFCSILDLVSLFCYFLFTSTLPILLAFKME